MRETIKTHRKPIARPVLERPSASNKRVPGIDKGKLWISDDFDSLPELELAVWCGSKPPAPKRPRK